MSEILVVDDDRDVAQTIKLALRRKGFQAQLAYSGAEAIKMLQYYRPSLIVLDVIMPGMNGFEVCRHIRDNPATAAMPIIFLTARGQDDDRIEGFRAGGDDYLTKPFNLEELLLRVQAILRRSITLPITPTDQLTVGEITLNIQSFSVQTHAGTVLLTPTEFELLHYLMAHAGQIFSSERLLREVWNFPNHTGSSDLVRAHVKNLRDKIEPDPKKPVHLQTVPRHGYVFYG